jgi:hypothetical protein
MISEALKARNMIGILAIPNYSAPSALFFFLLHATRGVAPGYYIAHLQCALT